MPALAPRLRYALAIVSTGLFIAVPVGFALADATAGAEPQTECKQSQGGGQVCTRPGHAELHSRPDPANMPTTHSQPTRPSNLS